jgi:hypothetical protein
MLQNSNNTGAPFGGLRVKNGEIGGKGEGEKGSVGERESGRKGDI